MHELLREQGSFLQTTHMSNLESQLLRLLRYEPHNYVPRIRSAQPYPVSGQLRGCIHGQGRELS